MNNEEKLQIYEYPDYNVIMNFQTYDSAVKYAQDNNGTLIEVGFLDGTDTLTETNEGNLIQNKRLYGVYIGPEYNVLYSDDERFQEYADKILKDMKVFENDVAPEDWLADQNIAKGDRIIILKNGEINTVTTKERIKYLMQGNLYELAVKVHK